MWLFYDWAYQIYLYSDGPADKKKKEQQGSNAAATRQAWPKFQASPDWPPAGTVGAA